MDATSIQEDEMASMGDPIRLSEPQVTAAALVLARAFQEDAGTVYMIPPMVGRSRGLPFLFTPIIRYALVHGEGYITEGGDAVALWLPPGGTTPTPEGMGEAGIGDAAHELGAEVMDRLVNLTTYLETLHAQIMPESHWRLFFRSVMPERQGQGVGSALIQPALERFDAAGQPCYLETLEARNVPFYKRHGFRVALEGDVPDGALHVWAMRRG
jgi:GNAT superfamily N-acetyltransferase